MRIGSLRASHSSSPRWGRATGISSLYLAANLALAVVLVARVDPGNRRRALLAGGLLLFLPAHVMMSAMLSEELLAAAFASCALVGACWMLARPRVSSAGWLLPKTMRATSQARAMSVAVGMPQPRLKSDQSSPGGV